MKDKTCSYCEFYDPFMSDLFNEYTDWGYCRIDKENSKAIDDGIGNYCDKFKNRVDNDMTDFMDRCGVLNNH